MKKINFKAIEIEVNIDDFQKLDISKEIANILFQNAPSLEIDELSRKIHYSTGEIEIEDLLFSQMIEILLKFLPFRLIDSIKTSIL